VRIWSAVTGVLRRVRPAPLLVIQSHSGDGPVAAALRRADAQAGLGVRHSPVRQRPFLHRRSDPTYAAEWVDKKHLADLARRRRQLSRTLGCPVDTVDRAAGGLEAAAIDEFLDLEASGWKRRTGTSLRCRPGHDQFFRELSRGFAEQGRLMLLRLQSGTQVLAQSTALLAGPGQFGFKKAYDEAFARWSPGTLLDLDVLMWFHHTPQLRWLDTCSPTDAPSGSPLFGDRRAISTLLLPLSPVGTGPRRCWRRPCALARTSAASETGGAHEGRLRRWRTRRPLPLHPHEAARPGARHHRPGTQPLGLTYGWGVVFWDDPLDAVRHSDPPTAGGMEQRSFRWVDQLVQVEGGQAVSLGGGGYGLGRQALLDLLSERAAGLGVRVLFEHEADDRAQLDGADLVVACDGVNSRLRRRHQDQLQTSIAVGSNPYVWLGTSRVFEAFTFAFAQTSAGWIWFHAYAFNDEASTLIVECAPETWAGLGFDRPGVDDSLRLLQQIFERCLEGHRLLVHARDDRAMPWLRFRSVSNRRWHPREPRADGGRRPHYPLHHRVGYEAGRRGRDRARRAAARA
jgi:Acetyltransferase (GNAT) domain